MTLPAARLTSKSMGEPTFPPTIAVEGNLKVLIAGLPAVTMTSKFMPHTRILPPFDTHIEMVISGSSKVLIGGLPAARITDKLMFGDIITEGEPKVLIG